MADAKIIRGPQDRSRVAMGEDYEIDHRTGKFGVSRERLQGAVDAVGNRADAVERYLTR